MFLDAVDYLLLPVYIFIFYLVIKIKKKHYEDSGLKKYLIYGFWAKVFGSISFALFMAYYYKAGDSFVYYTGGLDFKAAILNKFKDNFHFIYSPAETFGEYYEMNFDKTYNYGYLSASSNLLAAKFVAFFSLFTFNSYLIISLYFGLFSFSGLWQSFKILSEKYPSLRKQLALGFLFLPSVLFWGSGIMKDTLCMGFLGWLFSSGYKCFIKKEFKFKSVVTFLISLYCLSVLKFYILIAFLPFFFLWIVFERRKRMHSFILTAIQLSLFFLLAAILLYYNKNNISDFLGEYSFENVAQTIASSKESYEKTSDEGALINSSQMEFTYAGILKKVPPSIVTALFRPFIWESRKAITFFSALENLAILLFTLYVLLKTRVKGFFTTIFKNNLLFFFFFFSIIFAAAIGLTCYNFGTLVRYKIPCMPFYLSSLVIILHLFKLNRMSTADGIKNKFSGA